MDSLKSDLKRLKINLNVNYSPEYVQHEIKKLQNSVTNIFYDNPLIKTYQELYMLVENLCTLNQEGKLGTDLTVIVSDFLKLQLLHLLEYEESDFLHKLKEFWLRFCKKTQLIKNIYISLEAASFRSWKKKISVSEMCMNIFQDVILSNNTVKTRLQRIYTLIEDERDSKVIDTKVINDLIHMLDKLSMYNSYFEEEFLIKSEKYYVEHRDLLIKGDILQYFYYVRLKLTEEENRVQQYLKYETEKKIILIVYRVLIEERLEELIEKLESANIFENGNLNDLTTLYNLLVPMSKSNKDLCKIFSNYIIRKGSELVSDVKNEQSLISNLLDFKDRINEIVNKCFKDHDMYMESVRSGFKHFLNQRKYKPAQFLAKFIDSRMRDKLTSEDLLDKIMVLFRYIQGKDVFEAHYKRYLSKRLLLGKSSSQDAEKYMISKLKLECGDGFTLKLEGMFRDIDLSDGLTNSFKQKYSDVNLAIEFSAHVLTSSFWPTFTKSTVTLPDTMLQYQLTFQQFYKVKYSGRSLQWVPSLGSCLMKGKLKNGKKEFQVSLFQSLVLLLFNESDTLTYKTIKMYLNLDDHELLRTVLSLFHGKIKLLIKTPSSLEVKDTDEFSINENFNHKLFRIKINELQYKETDEEQKITEEELIHDRHLQIDAALVRLMKQHRNMKHNDLISKIFSILKFPVNPNDIKKRIEILIERDFIVRNPEDNNAYLYVA